jgi:hypothetical protein
VLLATGARLVRLPALTKLNFDMAKRKYHSKISRPPDQPLYVAADRVVVAVGYVPPELGRDRQLALSAALVLPVAG